MADRIAEIQARLEAATPGPWYQAEGCDRPEEIGIDAVPNDKQGALHIAAIYGGISLSDFDGSSDGNAHLIAHAPTDIVYLLEELERWTQTVDNLTDEIERLRDG